MDGVGRIENDFLRKTEVKRKGRKDHLNFPCK